jgi:tyrosinase
MGFVRKNVWDLGKPWAPEILWYARAVKVMKARPLNSPLSWRFFGAIHGFREQSWAAVGQPAPKAQQPSLAEQRIFWKQCQHGSWYFLPWHRGYLLAFEKMVRAAMATLKGAPKDWALPYWNYFKPGQSHLPAEFASKKWPDGADDNPLFEAVRYGPNDDGHVFIEMTGQFAVEESTAFGDSAFIGAAGGGSPGFGGPETDLFSHSGNKHGGLESQPHDMAHVDIGGINRSGLMSDPDTAGLDPIFWLHHANIDRLWEAWKTVPKAAGNPASPKWLGGPASLGFRAFRMPMPDGSTWTYTPGDMGNLAPLDYSYDDIAPPKGIASSAQRLEVLGATPVEAAAMLEKVIAMPPKVELLGASEPGLRLSGGEARARVVLKPEVESKVMKSFSSMPTAAPDRVFLNLENVRAARDGTVFSVYVNLPDGADPAAHAELRAGSVALFGVRAASDADGEHGGEGLTFSLDITRIVDKLHLAGGLGNSTFDVRLVPRGQVPEDAGVTIGRIGVYRQEG